MSITTVTIANSVVQIKEGTLLPVDMLDQRSTCNFTVYDPTGLAHYSHMQLVSVDDTVSGNIFTGFVFTSKEINVGFPGPQMEYEIVCVDEHYKADKRVMQADYVNAYAGDILADTLQTTLAAEGITGKYAVQRSVNVEGQPFPDDLSTGTLTNLIADATIDDGNLEIAPSGIAFIQTDNTTALFNVNPLLVNIDTSNNQLQLTSSQAVQMTATVQQSNNNNFVYVEIWSGSVTIASATGLQYDVWVSSTSPFIGAGVDFVCTDGTIFRDYIISSGIHSGQHFTDRQGLSCHPNTDLSGYANDQWYSRSFDITPLAGKTIATVSMAMEGDPAGHYQAFFRHVHLNGAMTNVFFESSLATNNITNVNGYSHVSLGVVRAYDKTGYRNSNNFTMSQVGIVKNSIVAWQAITTAVTPTGSVTIGTVVVSTSIDGGTTFQQCINRQASPSLLPGMVLVNPNKTITTQQILTITGTDPLSSPTLQSITVEVLPSYTMPTKSDLLKTWTSNADFNLWSRSNTVVQANQIQLQGKQRDWNNGDKTSQSLFGTTGCTDLVQSSTYSMAVTGSGTDVRSRFDFAGTWGGTTNFVIDIDIYVNTSGDTGVEYLTTGWQNALNSFAYFVGVTDTTGGNGSIYLAKGSNGGGAATVAYVQSPFSISLSSGQWHHLQVVYTAATTKHQIYLDGVLMINVTDATYTAAGNVGVRYFNYAGGTHSGFYDNFGVMQSLTGTAISPSTAISLTPNLASASLITYGATAPNGCTCLVETNFNSTIYVAAQNGGSVYGLTNNVPTNGSSLLVRVTLGTPSAYLAPSLQGLTFWVVSQLQASGIRVSNALQLASAGRAGSAQVSWNGLTPSPGCTIQVDSSLDASTFNNVGFGAQGSGAIQGIAITPNPVTDLFLVDTSGNYTSTSKTSGVAGVVSIDTTNSRLTYVGGTNALFVLNSPSALDVDLITDIDEVDSGGLVWRYIDNNNYYDLQISDASSSATPNVMKLYKTVSGTRTQLGSTGTIAFTRGLYKRFRLTMLGGVITALMDGVQILTYTDGSPLASGLVGLSNVTGTSRYYQLRVAPQGQDLSGGYVGPIPDITDTFSSNDLASYTQTFASGGSASTWSIDTANDLLTGTGGTKGALLYTGASYQNGYAEIDIQQAEGAGIFLSWIDNNNFYYCLIWDDTSASNAQTLKLFKRVAGTGTQLGSNVPIVFPRFSTHTFRLSMQSGVLSVSMDGTILITSTEATPLAAGLAGMRCESVTQVFDRFTIHQVGTTQTGAAQAFNKITLKTTDPLNTPQITDITTSVHDLNIQQGSLIPSTNYFLKPCSTAFNDLSTQSNYWYKIKQGVLSFQPRTGVLAPFILSSSDALVSNIFVEDINDLYRNRQYVTGGLDVTSVQTITRLGDSITQAWTMPYALAPVPQLALHPPTVLLNGVSQTVGVKKVDVGKSFYWAPGDPVIIQDASLSPPQGDGVSASSDILVFSYQGQFEVQVRVDNATEQGRLQLVEGGAKKSTGIVEAVEVVNGLNYDACATLAQSLLNRYSVLGRTLTCTTLRPGLAVGQLLTVFLPQHAIADAVFLITRVAPRFVSTYISGSFSHLIYWDIEATEAAHSKDWTYFMRLLGKGA